MTINDVYAALSDEQRATLLTHLDTAKQLAFDRGRSAGYHAGYADAAGASSEYIATARAVWGRPEAQPPGEIVNLAGPRGRMIHDTCDTSAAGGLGERTV